MYDKKDEDNTYFERIDMSRPGRTPKQHKMLMERIVKIIRLFKPDDGTLRMQRVLCTSSFPEWFDKIRKRDVVDK